MLRCGLLVLFAVLLVALAGGGGFAPSVSGAVRAVAAAGLILVLCALAFGRGPPGER